MQKRKHIAEQESCVLEDSDTRCETLEEIQFLGFILYRGVEGDAQESDMGKES